MSIIVLSSSLRPVATVKVSVAYGLGNMVAMYAFRTFKVGNGAGNLQDAAVGAGRELQTLHGQAQEFAALGVQNAVFAQMLFRHLCIAMHSLDRGEALGLDVSGTQDPFSDDGTGFARCCRGDFLEGKRQYLALYVYAVEQRTADFIKVA